MRDRGQPVVLKLSRGQLGDIPLYNDITIQVEYTIGRVRQYLCGEEPAYIVEGGYRPKVLWNIGECSFNSVSSEETDSSKPE